MGQRYARSFHLSRVQEFAEVSRWITGNSEITDVTTTVVRDVVTKSSALKSRPVSITSTSGRLPLEHRLTPGWKIVALVHAFVFFRRLLSLFLYQRHLRCHLQFHHHRNATV